jgi:hypothetical protein
LFNINFVPSPLSLAAITASACACLTLSEYSWNAAAKAYVNLLAEFLKIISFHSDSLETNQNSLGIANEGVTIERILLLPRFHLLDDDHRKDSGINEILDSIRNRFDLKLATQRSILLVCDNRIQLNSLSGHFQVD